MKATAPCAAAQSTLERIPAPARFLGRQPIVNAAGRLFGYELLFRASERDAFSGDPEQATREVVDHWLMLLPEPNEACAFVNCTRAALMDGLILLLPPENTVLEILETVEPDPELIACCLALKDQGYRFALDDFVPSPSRRPFIPLADFIKIDFRASDFLVRRSIYEMASGSRAQLLAEKIETEAEMSIARSEGCTLFQGHFLAHPVLVTSRSVPQNQVIYLSLLGALHKVPVDLRQVENLVTGDASLCYRILRLANSVLHGHPGNVSTVREALLMVGEDTVRRLVTVAMAGALASRRSPAIISMALSRARFCESLAPSLGEPASKLYLLGMLSLLDVLLEIPISRILQSLPLTADMKSALAGDESGPGCALELVRSLESCDWDRCENMQHILGLPEGVIAGFYVDALRWASDMLGQ